MFDTLYTQIGGVIVIAILAFSFWKGDEPERFAAAAYAMAWLASMVVQDDAGLYSAQPAMFAIDLAVLLLFIGICWKAGRAWPYWAAAFQLLTVSGHILPLIDYRPPAYAYLTVITLASYGVVLSLGVGAFWAWQERRAAGLE